MEAMILRFKPLKFESFMVCFHLYDVTFGWVKLTSGLLMFLLLIFHCQTREVNSSQGNACNVNRLFQNVISDAFLISDIGYLNFNMLKNKQTYIYIHIRKYILYTIYIYDIYTMVVKFTQGLQQLECSSFETKQPTSDGGPSGDIHLPKIHACRPLRGPISKGKASCSKHYFPGVKFEFLEE